MKDENKINTSMEFFDIFDTDDENHNIETTCLNCGFTEYVPDFIYDEMSRKKYHLKINKKVSTLYCSRCQKETAISAFFLKKK